MLWRQNCIRLLGKTEVKQKKTKSITMVRSILTRYKISSNNRMEGAF